MAIHTGDQVNFIYVKGSELPAAIDAASVYFVEGSRCLYVGTNLISDLTDYDYISESFVTRGDILDDTTLQLYSGNDDVLSSIPLPKLILYDTTAHWAEKPRLQSKAGYLYIYSDYQLAEDGETHIPGFKVGDGNAYVVDLPFIDDLYMKHINDSTIHVSDQDRINWDNKVTAFVDPNDANKLILTKRSEEEYNNG